MPDKLVFKGPVYMLVNIKTREVAYATPAANQTEVWRDAIRRELLGTGHNKVTMTRLGWRVKLVEIIA